MFFGPTSARRIASLGVVVVIAALLGDRAQGAFSPSPELVTQCELQVFGDIEVKAPAVATCPAPWNSAETFFSSKFDAVQQLVELNNAAVMLNAATIVKTLLYPQNLASFNASNFSRYWVLRQSPETSEEMQWYDALGQAIFSSFVYYNVTTSYPQCLSRGTNAPIMQTLPPQEGPGGPPASGGNLVPQTPPQAAFDTYTDQVQQSVVLVSPKPASCPAQFTDMNSFGLFFINSAPTVDNANNFMVRQALGVVKSSGGSPFLPFNVDLFMTFYVQRNNQSSGLTFEDVTYLTNVADKCLQVAFFHNLTVQYPLCFAQQTTRAPIPDASFKEDERIQRIYMNLSMYRPASPQPVNCPNFTRERATREDVYMRATAYNVLMEYARVFADYFKPAGLNVQMYLTTLQVLDKQNVTVKVMLNATGAGDGPMGPPGSGSGSGSMNFSGSGNFSFNGSFSGGNGSHGSFGNFSGSGSHNNSGGSHSGNGSLAIDLERVVQYDIVMMAGSLVLLPVVEADMRCRPSTVATTSTTRVTTSRPASTSAQQSTSVISTSRPTSAAITTGAVQTTSPQSTNGAPITTRVSTAASTTVASTSTSAVTSTSAAGSATTARPSNASTTTVPASSNGGQPPTTTTTSRSNVSASSTSVTSTSTTGGSRTNSTSSTTLATGSTTTTTTSSATGSTSATSATGTATTAAPSPTTFTATVSLNGYNETALKQALAAQLGVDPSTIVITMSTTAAPPATTAPPTGAPGSNATTVTAVTTSTAPGTARNATITITFTGATAATASTQMAALTQNTTALAALGLSDVQAAADGSTAAPVAAAPSEFPLIPVIAGAALLLVIVGVVGIVMKTRARGSTVSQESHLSDWEQELRTNAV